MPTKVPLFSAKNLSLTFPTGDQIVQAVQTCNVTIPEQAVTIIFGASGSGKSSLLNVISGLQKPTSGSLFYRNTNIYDQSHDELAYYRAHELGIVYQTNYWVKSLNVLDNVAMPLYFQGFSQTDAHRRAQEALSAVDMAKFAKKHPVWLSGGEQQRVAVARAIVADPPVIIADEPTGSLDSKNGDSIIKLLKNLRDGQNKTVVLVTHNMEYLHIANHLLEVQDGSVTQIEENQIPKTIDKMLGDTQKRITELMKGSVGV